MSRYGPDSDRITIARRLSGTATRHAREPGDRAAAIAELIEIATEKRAGHAPRLRTDLMEQAAGSLIGGYWHSALAYWSARIVSRSRCSPLRRWRTCGGRAARGSVGVEMQVSPELH